MKHFKQLGTFLSLLLITLFVLLAYQRSSVFYNHTSPLIPTNFFDQYKPLIFIPFPLLVYFITKNLHSTKAALVAFSLYLFSSSFFVFPVLSQTIILVGTLVMFLLISYWQKINTKVKTLLMIILFLLFSVFICYGNLFGDFPQSYFKNNVYEVFKFLRELINPIILAFFFLALFLNQHSSPIRRFNLLGLIFLSFFTIFTSVNIINIYYLYSIVPLIVISSSIALVQLIYQSKIYYKNLVISLITILIILSSMLNT